MKTIVYEGWHMLLATFESVDEIPALPLDYVVIEPHDAALIGELIRLDTKEPGSIFSFKIDVNPLKGVIPARILETYLESRHDIA